MLLHNVISSNIQNRDSETQLVFPAVNLNTNLFLTTILRIVHENCSIKMVKKMKKIESAVQGWVREKTL